MAAAVAAAVCLGLLAAVAVYALCIYALAPWLGVRLRTQSDLEFSVAAGLATAAAIACGWRVLLGATAEGELQRLGDVVGSVDEADGSPASFDDAGY